MNSILPKGAIVTISNKNVRKYMKCKKDIPIKIVDRVSIQSWSSIICLIYKDTRIVVSNHSHLFEDLEYKKLDYSFYILHNQRYSFIEKGSLLLVVDHVYDNGTYLANSKIPVFVMHNRQIYYLHESKLYPIIISFIDLSIRLANGSIHIPNKLLWKHSGCIITAKQPTQYQDLDIICV